MPYEEKPASRGEIFALYVKYNFRYQGLLGLNRPETNWRSQNMWTHLACSDSFGVINVMLEELETYPKDFWFEKPSKFTSEQRQELCEKIVKLYIDDEGLQLFSKETHLHFRDFAKVCHLSFVQVMSLFAELFHAMVEETYKPEKGFENIIW